MDPPPPATTIEITQINDENPPPPVPVPTPAPANNEPPAERINPNNRVWWIVIESTGNIGKVVAATVVLLLAVRDGEHTQAPRLFNWLIGHVLGSIGYLLLTVCRRLCFRNRHRPIAARVSEVVEFLDLIFYVFFSVWFMLGNFWVVADQTSEPTDAPKLYWMSLLILIISVIGFAMPPLVLFVFFVFVFPCRVFFRELQEQVRGATRRSIATLPTYTFQETEDGAGVVAAGTEHERHVNQQDAVCSVCLENYQNNDELKHLPCGHFFHTDCIVPWLKQNASCPMCKAGTGETVGVCC